eukprot:3996546-Pyramimonas_sp.AAC.1
MAPGASGQGSRRGFAQRRRLSSAPSPQFTKTRGQALVPSEKRTDWMPMAKRWLEDRRVFLRADGA